MLPPALVAMAGVCDWLRGEGGVRCSSFLRLLVAVAADAGCRFVTVAGSTCIAVVGLVDVDSDDAAIPARRLLLLDEELLGASAPRPPLPLMGAEEGVKGLWLVLLLLLLLMGKGEL